MVNFIKTYIRYVIEAQNAYRGEGMMMALYFVALIIIFAYCKDKKTKKAILMPTVLIMAILYLGIPLFNTMDHYFEFFDGRFFWLLITPIVTAIGLTYLITNIENTKVRIASLVFMVPICLYCGVFKLSDSIYKKSENAYKLPQVSVDMTEYLLSQDKDPILLVPYTFSYDFRQISSDIMLEFGEDATSGRIYNAEKGSIIVCDQMERVIPDLNYIHKASKWWSTEYIVFDTVYMELCENGNINIDGYPIDENYVGDRTPTISYDELLPISVVEDEKGVYWDLSEYCLEFEGRFGQYVLYRFNHKE